jgi:hypothetical protein
MASELEPLTPEKSQSVALALSEIANSLKSIK